MGSLATVTARTVVLATIVVAAVLPAIATAALGVDALDPATVEDCDRAVARDPGDLDAWACYFEAARRRGSWVEATSRLEAVLREDPTDPRARLALGSIRAFQPGEDAESTLRDAARALDEAGDVEGAFRARAALFDLLEIQGFRDAADDELERMLEILDAHSTPERLAGARLRQADRALRTGATAQATAWLLEVRDAGPRPSTLARVENALGRVAWNEGRLADAQARFRRSADLYRSIGDGWAEADERYNEALAAGRRVALDEIGPDEVLELVDRQIEIAAAAGNPGAEAQGRTLLAQHPALPRDDRIDQADRALDVLRRTTKFHAICFAMRLAAKLRIDRGTPRDRVEAVDLLDEAAGLARARGILEDEARAWIVRANLAPSRSDAKFRECYERAVDIVERMRDLRADRLSRGRFLWDWVMTYNRLVGAYLDTSDGAPDASEIDRAFRTMERLRARLTLDALDAAGATERAYRTDRSTVREREEVLAAISAAQRDLARPGASAQKIAELSSALVRLEAREASLREDIARDDVAFARLRAVAPVGVEAIRERLAPGEALIAFQAATREIDGRSKWWWNGGSWAIAVTRRGARAFALPDEDVLADRIALHRGLLRNDDDREPAAAARLYRDVLADAFESFPDDVDHVILVPDGPLHRLPFDALRASPDDPPLAARVAITIAPSATLWARNRDRSAALPRGTLAFADPAPPRSAAVAASIRGEHGPLGRLPLARDEVESVARAIGAPAEILVGARASERELKRRLPGPGALVHIAAHAIVHADDPARTAVVLASGGPADDGLLQLREIVSLPLDGRVVWLSACSGAEGEIVSGEGVVGLAGGFFQAGARAVVAGLWPVRDRDARDLLAAAGDAWARGATLEQAMASARRSAIDAGRPASEWAGWIVLGDGDVRLDAAPTGGEAEYRENADNPGVVALVLLVCTIGVFAGLVRRS